MGTWKHKLIYYNENFKINWNGSNCRNYEC